jgi:hypothetical protein
MNNEIKDHLYAQLEKVAIVTDPFPYFYMRDVLPAQYYEKLIAGLPVNESYDRFPAPYESRLGLDLSRKSLDKFPESGRAIWQEFEAWIHSQEFLDKIAAKFQPFLDTNASYRKEQLKKAATGPSTVRIEPRSLLVRDYSNFAISPHTDSASKTIVGAFYLPKDESQKPFGTSFYRARNPSFTDWDSELFENADFEVAYTAEYLPNSMLFFMKCDHSFHGVEQREYSNTGRDVLFWTPAIAGKQITDKPLSLPTDLFLKKGGLLSQVKKLFA